MKYIFETERLKFREISMQDIDDLFEMDSDPDVHKFIEQNPVKSKAEIVDVVNLINKQYADNGIARWAVIDKESGECIGWAGLKYFREELNNHKDFYELGYRFKQKHWGKGYATESSKAIINYGFEVLHLNQIYAITHLENVNSINVLKKLGFEFIEIFDYEGDLTNWFKLINHN